MLVRQKQANRRRVEKSCPRGFGFHKQKKKKKQRQRGLIIYDTSRLQRDEGGA